MDGLLLVDKPEGISSFDVVRQVRRLTKTRKVGHGGTLDPFASGLLPLALGQATRLLEYVLDADKSYRAVMQLGVETDTQDRTGRVTGVNPVPAFSRAELEDVFRRFIGTISQVPPMFSALKKDGVPLYKMARRGQDVQRRARRVRIHSLKVLDFTRDYIVFSVTCSKGTYVRTLAQDIGRALGCGAHLTELRRTASGPFRVEDAIGFEHLVEMSAEQVDASILEPLKVMDGYRRVSLGPHEARLVANGQMPDTIAEQLDQQQEAGPVCLIVGNRLAAIAGRRESARKHWALEKVFNAP